MTPTLPSSPGRASPEPGFALSCGSSWLTDVLPANDGIAAVPVKRRHVFFISGFDPRGPVFYHRLYREEAAKQSKVSGLQLQVGKRQAVDDVEHRWTVTTADTDTTISFLRYEHIIRSHWPASGPAMAMAILRYIWHFLRMGVLRSILRNSWPCFIAVVYPLAVVAGGFLLAAAVYILAVLVLAELIGGWAWLAVLPIPGLPLLAYQPLDKTYNAFWLARSCQFLVLRALGRAPGIEKRCETFASRVAEAVNGGANDEVLLVGHSVGAHVSVTVAARALERMKPGATLRYLTLGHAIAMTPSEPQARQFRDDLLALSASANVEWLDVTSAVDGSCLALTDPLAASGVARPPGARVQPKLVSSRFNRLFSPGGYKSIRRNFLRAHFQYLMAAELPGDYDYFLITGGDRTLEHRFARIDSVTDFNRFRMGRA